MTLGRASNKQSEEETHAMSQKVIESISADILSKIQKRQQKLEQNEIVDIQTRNDLAEHQPSMNETGEFPDRELGDPEEMSEVEAMPEERELTLAEQLEIDSLGTSGYHSGEGQIDEEEVEKHEKEALQRELEAAERHLQIQQRIQDRKRRRREELIEVKLQHHVLDVHQHHQVEQ